MTYLRAMKRSNRNQKGISLVEMVMSVTILSIAVLAGAYILLQARQMGEESRQRLVAANVAKTVLETVKNTALANVSAISTTGLVPATLPGGTISITTNPANVSGQSLATVTVRVQWTGPRNSTRTLDVSTQRSSY